MNDNCEKHRPKSTCIDCGRCSECSDKFEEKIAELKMLIICGITVMENCTANHPEIEVDAVLYEFKESLK